MKETEPQGQALEVTVHQWKLITVDRKEMLRFLVKMKKKETRTL